MTIHRDIWERFKKLPHYHRATLIALLIALILLFCMIGINPADLLGSHWFFSFIIIPTFMGSVTAGATYLARILDDRHPGRYGSSIGACMGVGLAITLLVLGGTVPFSASLGGLAFVVFTLGYVNNFSGLAHRLETIAVGPKDQTKCDRPPKEKWIMGLTIAIALIVGIILLSTSSFALVSIAGVTTFLTGGFAAPVWLLGAITLVRFVSISASFADYFSKAVTLVMDWLGKTSQNEKGIVARELKQRNYEYKGSLVGVLIGIALGVALIVALAIIHPPLFAGGFGVLLGFMIIGTCGSVWGGILSRIFRGVDGCLAADKKVRENEARARGDSFELAPLVGPSPSTSIKFDSPQDSTANDLGVVAQIT